ncbi:MAG: type I-B CRISPR-associated protein Cas8b1/Cst1 [Ardenticatenales bacterium]|nr:type I-B CRISPR-associated protein Cas8b1/Cst1 [Ardenticatenales bacterium]
MLKYTGHPLVDGGAATITVFAEKRHPSQVTQADLDAIADYIAYNYTRPPLLGFIHGAIFPNSGYTNPGIKGDRKDYFGPYLYAYRVEPPSDANPCVFCKEPSVLQVARDYFPLLLGRDVINFYPWGEAGLPICGRCLLCVQAYSLGAGGFMLVVHSDSEAILQHFARSFLKDNRQAVQLAQAAGDKKPERSPFTHRTYLITKLLSAEVMQRDEREFSKPFSVTAYLLSNSGQNPSLEILHLPLQTISFLSDMRRADYREKWNTIVQRAWEVAPTKKKATKGDGTFQPRRNWLYEDIFKLPENARAFLRTYLLREALRYARSNQGDPRGGYSLKDEVELVSWAITERFLWRIMHMDKERIAQIRTMGDQLAEYVSSQNDRQFFRNFFIEQRPAYFRTILIKANLAHVKRGNPPLFTLDPYIEVFEEGQELSRPDWRLARDLVLIRMVEQLHQRGWLGKNADAIPETDDQDAAQSE